MTDEILRVRDLAIGSAHRRIVDGVGFRVGAGERVGLIGESGSGKSLTALAIMGLLPENLHVTGSIRLAGVDADLTVVPTRQRTRLRGSRMGMVFQEPMTALDPTMRVGMQVGEALRIHGVGRDQARIRSHELLAKVELPDPERIARAYPGELSGGQRQRVCLAIALANAPELLICDEPTTALDVTVQARMLELIDRSVARSRAALVFISHDLAVVSSLCERVVVMHDGRVVEQGPTVTVLERPEHPYTRSLVAASRLPARTPAPEPAQGSPEPKRVLVEARQLGRTFPSRAFLSSAFPGQALTGRGTEGARGVDGTDGPRGVQGTQGTPRTRGTHRAVEALRGVDLAVREGDRLGIVGESGSGKSTLVRLLVGLDEPTSGDVLFRGRRVSRVPERSRAQLRRDVQLVFQDPASSLDPRMRVGRTIAEPLRDARGPAAAERVAELLDAVGLPADSAQRFPHEFSGGQRQRIAIARALASNPRVLFADEPVSALDVSVRSQVLALLSDLVDRFGMTLVFVSHDLSVVRALCDRVVVLYRGEVVEQGPTARVFERPEHPYTRGLLDAVPHLPGRAQNLR